jgi:F-type H+-transporting ATPase subunit delta
MQVLRIMLEKGRENEIESVRLEYVALRRKHEGVVLATVTTALPLEEDLKLALVAKLEKSLGAKIETEYKVDPDLIGGIRVAYGDYVLDGSARGSLRLIREKLRYDVLKQV